jgi:hypothetical protein
VVARIDALNKAFDVQERKANEAIATARKELPEKQKAAGTRKKHAKTPKKPTMMPQQQSPPHPRESPMPLCWQRKEASTKLAAAITALTSAETAVIAAETTLKTAMNNLKSSPKRAFKTPPTARKPRRIRKPLKKRRLLHKPHWMLSKPQNPKQICNHSQFAFQKTRNQSQSFSTTDGSKSGPPSGPFPRFVFLRHLPSTPASLASPANSEFLTFGSDGRLAKTAGPDRWKLERTLGGANPDSPFIDRVWRQSASALTDVLSQQAVANPRAPATFISGRKTRARCFNRGKTNTTTPSPPLIA